MEYRVSEYNFFVRRPEGGGIVYNAASGSFTYVALAVFEDLQRKNVPNIELHYLTRLAEAGIIHSGEQKSQLMERFELQKAARSNVSIVIAPTIECNFACWYCYQNGHRHVGAMSDLVQKNTLQFIDAVLRLSQSFSVTWYGGEPLLALDVIENISEALNQRYSTGVGVPEMLPPDIVTNGMLLSDQVVTTLKRLNFSNAQVSFDGYYHVPPTRRGIYLRGGTPSPILANILRFRDQLHFNIRINTSSLEEGDVARITEALSNHGLKELAYFARIEDNVSECNSLAAPPDGFMTRKEYAKTEAALVEQQSLQQYVNRVQRALRPKGHFCGATKGDMFVIDFKGDISRCWISAGRSEEKIGNVSELFSIDALDDSEVDQKWREYTPFNFSDCRDCRVLPLCMGGCSHARVLHGAVQSPCEAIKYNINKYVADIGSRLPLNQGTEQG